MSSLKDVINHLFVALLMKEMYHLNEFQRIFWVLQYLQLLLQLFQYTMVLLMYHTLL